jgi:transposase
MLRYSVPPGYRRLQPVRRPKLGAWIGTIDQIPEDGKAEGKKQRHTAKRIFQRLRDEHSYTGGYTIVKDYVRLRKLSQREMFVPLAHPPGDAQAAFAVRRNLVWPRNCKGPALLPRLQFIWKELNNGLHRTDGLSDP